MAKMAFLFSKLTLVSYQKLNVSIDFLNTYPYIYICRWIDRDIDKYTHICIYIDKKAYTLLDSKLGC